MSLNNIITSVSSLVSDYSISDINNVICIDTLNNNIGIKNSSPIYDLDISGIKGIRTNAIYLNNLKNLNTSNIYDINYDYNFLKFANSINVNNIVDCSQIITNILDVSYIINSNNNTIQFNQPTSFLKNINSSINCLYNISCNNLISNYTKTDNINSNINKYINVLTDISFASNVNIENNLNVYGTIFNNSNVLVSDKRLKTEEQNIKNGLDIIRKLEPKFYKKTNKLFNKNEEKTIFEAGLYAQDIYDINDLSYCVHKGCDITPYYLNYNNILIYSIAAIKELDNTINNNLSLNKDKFNLNNIEKLITSQNLLIQTLNNKINYLENRLSKLE